jgi:hypothetical protein
MSHGLPLLAQKTAMTVARLIMISVTSTTATNVSLAIASHPHTFGEHPPAEHQPRSDLQHRSS